MRVMILCVGKIKERYFTDAIAEYAKRLSKYCNFEIIEVMDEKTPENASMASVVQILEKEGKRLLDKIKEDYCVCTLEIKGNRLSSKQLAGWIEKQAVDGKSNLVFVIGGSLGLHESVLKRANFRLSFSDMTFPHQLMRVILCEQIYRSFRIIHNEPYHK